MPLIETHHEVGESHWRGALAEHGGRGRAEGLRSEREPSVKRGCRSNGIAQLCSRTRFASEDGQCSAELLGAGRRIGCSSTGCRGWSDRRRVGLSGAAGTAAPLPRSPALRPQPAARAELAGQLRGVHHPDRPFDAVAPYRKTGCRSRTRRAFTDASAAEGVQGVGPARSAEWPPPPRPFAQRGARQAGRPRWACCRSPLSTSNSQPTAHPSRPLDRTPPYSPARSDRCPSSFPCVLVGCPSRSSCVLTPVSSPAAAVALLSHDLLWPLPPSSTYLRPALLLSYRLAHALRTFRRARCSRRRSPQSAPVGQLRTRRRRLH
jgi:hypothetical protein